MYSPTNLLTTLDHAYKGMLRPEEVPDRIGWCGNYLTCSHESTCLKKNAETQFGNISKTHANYKLYRRKTASQKLFGSTEPTPPIWNEQIGCPIHFEFDLTYISLVIAPPGLRGWNHLKYMKSAICPQNYASFIPRKRQYRTSSQHYMPLENVRLTTC